MNNLKTRVKIKISRSGEISYIYCDELAALSKGGSIVRVSNVEPTHDGFWQATMSNGIQLGKHLLRKDALLEEVKYIEDHFLLGKGMENASSQPTP